MKCRKHRSRPMDLGSAATTLTRPSTSSISIIPSEPVRRPAPFGGFAATGAIARTATNIRNGGTSPLAGLAHAATPVAVLLVLTPLAASVPVASLGDTLARIAQPA